MVLSVFFYLLHKRLESLSSKMNSNMAQLIEWMETLRYNQSVLETDLKKVYHEFQEYQNTKTR